MQVILSEQRKVQIKNAACDEKVNYMLDAKATIALKLVGTRRFEIQVWLVEIDLKFNFGCNVWRYC